MKIKTNQKNKTRWWVWLLLLCTCAFAFLIFLIYCIGGSIVRRYDDSKDPNAFKILFIGNSLIFTNDLPAIFSGLAKQDLPNRALKVYSAAYPDYYLCQHLVNDKTLQAISSGPWDYVILQEHSVATPYLRLSKVDWANIIGVVKNTCPQAKICIFEIWGDEDWTKPEFSKLLENYEKLSTDLHCRLIPIGKCWMDFNTNSTAANHPSLYLPDKHHPSAAGAYLSACAIYAYIFKRLPDPLPTNVTEKWLQSDRSIVSISSEDANVLGSIARSNILMTSHK